MLLPLRAIHKEGDFELRQGLEAPYGCFVGPKTRLYALDIDCGPRGPTSAAGRAREGRALSVPPPLVASLR